MQLRSVQSGIDSTIRQSIARQYLAVMIIGCVLCLSFDTFAGMRCSGGPVAWGGSCESDYPNAIAGSLVYITIDNSADQPATLRERGWPDGYYLEAEIDPPPNTPFRPTPGLIERFNPTPHLRDLTLIQQQRLLSNDSTGVDLVDLNLKFFSLLIPSDLIGHTVTFRARCTKSKVETVSASDWQIRVIAACDRMDSSRIVASYIYLAWQIQDYNRAVELADSMMYNDLSDVSAWKWAMSAADHLQRPDRHIFYLDHCYNDFGVTWVPGGATLPLDRGGTRDPMKQESYERKRNELLRWKAEIEQRQQH